jgi:hypothetical protein
MHALHLQGWPQQLHWHQHTKPKSQSCPWLLVTAMATDGTATVTNSQSHD